MVWLKIKLGINGFLCPFGDWETTACLHKSSKVFFSTDSSKSGDNADNAGGLDIGDDDFLTERPELTLQGVDPRKGWNFRGVHRVRLILVNESA